MDDKKWRQNNPNNNGREETSPGPLQLTIIYHFKKQTVEKLTSQARNTHDLHVKRAFLNLWTIKID
jgi:hypothetical protein